MIRPATPQDAQAIAEVNVRAWHRAYVDVVPSQALAERTVESVAARFGGLLVDGDGTWAVAEVDGRVAGFCCVGAARPEDSAVAGALRSLYVEPLAQGAGLGSTLHDQALSRLRSLGFGEALLWAFRDNGHGRLFYEDRGWTYDEGSEALAPAEWIAPSVRYRRAL